MIIDLLTENTMSIKDLLDSLNTIYYQGDNNHITDSTFDALKEQYEKETSKQFKDNEDLSNKPVSKLIKHETTISKIKKLNQSKVDYNKTLSVKYLEEILESPVINTSYKLDGVSIHAYYTYKARVTIENIEYDSYSFYQLLTRGDTIHGVNITHKKDTVIEDICDIIYTTAVDKPSNKIVLSGEAFLPLSVFKTKVKNYASPRSVATALINQIGNSKTIKLRSVFFKSKSMFHMEQIIYYLKGQKLRDLFYKYNDCDITVTFNSDISLKSLKDKSKELNIPTDGIVCEHINKKRTDKEFTAIKWQAETATTTVTDITWTVGEKSGRYTPIVSFEYVVIGGTTLTKCSLGSEKVLKALGVQIGSIVEVSKIGDAIPQITKVLKP